MTPGSLISTISMGSKTKNTKKTSEGIKSELDILFDLNRSRKAALEKISKLILDEDNHKKEHKSPMKT